MYHTASVAVENMPYPADKLYTYHIPDGLLVVPGQRVWVSFGGGGRKRVGIVVETSTILDRAGLKPISDTLDDLPILSQEALLLLRHLKETTFCRWFDALRLLIPNGLSIISQDLYSLGENPPEAFLEAGLEQDILLYIAKKRSPVAQGVLAKQFKLTDDNTIKKLLDMGFLSSQQAHRPQMKNETTTMVSMVYEFKDQPLSPKQKKVYEFLTENQTASLKEVCYYCGCTKAVVDALVKKGGAEYLENIVLRTPYDDCDYDECHKTTLSPPQQLAFETLCGYLTHDKPRPALLYGVTGSGKTEVFISLIEKTLALGRSVLVMVPEISLTSQVVENFRRRFGKRVAVLHSALSLGERMDEWQRIKNGDADVVVGTRSAVFAPLSNIGLIVIDEEQEHTYKSDKSPRFHARDVALFRASLNNALLLLSSATPSVESYYNAASGRYNLVTLPERFGAAVLPDVYIIDMKDPAIQSEYSSFSSVLLDEICYNIEHKEQSILLLNRRGHSTLIRCPACSTAAECPNCSVALTYHLTNDSLICHYCGYRADSYKECAKCGSGLIRYSGVGTQKVTEELAKIYPNARILRVDTDTTMSKFSHQKLFGDFLGGEYDIMVGTQMVAKGLNFPDVTLVGVLNADQSLYSQDFRSYERSFSLLTQVIGRAGRGKRRGRALVQTYSPENPIISLAAEQNYPAFYKDEIESRKLHLYPPFCYMSVVGFVGKNLVEVVAGAEKFLQQFKLFAAGNYPTLPIRVLGPVPADVLKTAGKYRYKLIIKCKNNSDTRDLLSQTLSWFLANNKQVHPFIDMHYDRF